VSNTAVGSYTVTFSGLGAFATEGGIVGVTAFTDGADAYYCNVQNWGQVGPTGGDIVINVVCFTPAGAPTNAQFFAAYQRGLNSYTQSTNATNPFPNRNYSRTIDSSHTPITIARTEVGRYTVTFPYDYLNTDRFSAQLRRIPGQRARDRAIILYLRGLVRERGGRGRRRALLVERHAPRRVLHPGVSDGALKLTA
jgi:hypothetical protein